MKILTILLIFLAAIFVLIPMVVMVVPSSKSCTNEEQCSSLRRRLQLVALCLLGVAFICLGLVIFNMYQNRSNTEQGESSKINKYLSIGLAAIVLFSGFIVPWLTSLAQSSAEYANYPPKDDCPHYWKKSGNDNSWTCTPDDNFSSSYGGLRSLTVNRADMNSAVTQAKGKTIFWDGFYNGGYLT